MNSRLPLSIQHQVPAFLGPLCTLLLFAAVALGQFELNGDRDPLLAPFSLILLLPPIGRTVWSIVVRRPVVTGRLDQRLLGADLLLLAVALLQGEEGTRSPVVFLLYAAACGLGLMFGARRVAPAVVLAAVALLGGFAIGAVEGGLLGLLVTTLGLVAFAFVPPSAVSRAQTQASEARRRLETIENAARDLGEDSARRQQQVRQADYTPEAVEADLHAMGERIQQWLWDICRTLVSGTGAERCLAYRPAAEGGELHLAAHSADPGEVARSVLAREGVFGVVLKTGESLMMSTVKQPYAGLAYAEGDPPVGSLLVVPLLMHQQLWGVLVLDAPEPERITPRDRTLVEGVAPLLLLLLDQLADLTAYRKGSSEHKLLHDISQALAEQESLDAVARILVDRSRGMVDAAGGALALLDRDATPHVVFGSGFTRDPTGLIFPFDSTTSLLAQCIRYGRAISRSALHREKRPPMLFGPEYGPSAAVSDLLLVPLLEPGSADEERRCIGALALCRSDDRPFAEDDRDRVEMLTHQAAAHIRAIGLLEDTRSQAATDGLTGLPNRRSFVERLDEMLQRAERFGTPVSLLMLDVDHFKHVNDTYGHPVGDQVLRKLAELLAGSVRDAVDMAARFGGEEFAVLLENTAQDGAVKMADRLREALAAETFVHVEGSNTIPFQVTMSLGVATTNGPEDPHTLVDRADQALYRAKEGGRNRVEAG